MINGTKLPDANNRGRVMPYRHGPQFCGPAIVDGKIWVVKLWENVTVDGRSYFRLVFETPAEAEMEP